MEKQVSEMVAAMLPYTEHGWAIGVVLVVYLLCREWIHRWIERASR